MIYLLIFIVQFIFLFYLSKTLTRNVSNILYKLTRNQDIALKFFHLIFLPGVFIHELSHLLSAKIMFVQTGELKLSPERIGNEVKMGSVQIQKTDPIRRALIGFAPVLFGFLLMTLSIFYLLSDKSTFGLLINYLLVFIIVFEIGNTMFSSKKDLEGTMELLIFFALIFILAFILGFKFPDINVFLNQSQIQEVLSKGIKILFIPIIIDGVIIFFAKFIF